ncbi:hypothetical protein KGQ20_07585 [Catenulispora sp. NF23]|uniref:Secreted protein n=1 Tax=Catenulispora pinistramenti TaxID=2705254 RepID=A0ABS5KNM1_9ACTN|nr:hypothetical protein [Catenulispora pinistramenti]MBS2532632.1 hypothetical protein [Catenulispora pinistramenti]MBS2547611.1 hypothetical protein [Catenulispora pinistramenti]
MRRLAFTAGLITGYVLGARAGRDRYEQLAKSARSVIGHPAAIRARTKAKGTIRSGIDAVAAKTGFSPVTKDDVVIDGTA